MKMKERKYVKFRVDMYDDTKFKIIDMKPERDLIHYIWTRIVTLAGKVNLEGELFLSKNIPYTAETLAIEFNRDIFQVKSALNILVELEMIELSEDKIYKVKNFVRHQNIKVKEKNIIKEKAETVKDKEIREDKKNKDESDNNKTVQCEVEENNKVHGTIERNINSEFNENLNDSSMHIDSKKNKRKYKRKNKSINKSEANSIADEELNDISVESFTDGDFERPLALGESFIGEWSF